MTKTDRTETTYEYDKDGNIIKKTVVETHEEDNTIYSNPWVTTTPYTFPITYTTTDTTLKK